MQQLAAWQQKVEVALSLSKINVQERYTTIEACQDVLQKTSHDGIVQVPFLQHFNTWRSIPSVKRLVTSSSHDASPLIHYAKVLMDVSNVKLYQDSLFVKRKNDGPTPWHSDARMAPFDTSKMITFWIPLDYIPRMDDGGTGLLFVNGSHSDFALPFWNVDKDRGEYNRLEERYGGDDGIEHYMPMNVGDVSAHAGWTLHSANGGIGNIGSDRYALAVTYVDAKAEIRQDAVHSKIGHDEDRRSYEDWASQVQPRSYFEHPLVPTF
jgi:ectoine hydroxylase-related dioxygenase (phytanoyl-CoA dioxygenase family)